MTAEWNREDLARLLALEDFSEIYAQADEVQRREKRDVVQIRAILEFSNCCRRRCRYCGLNAENPRVTRYRMSVQEMKEAAAEAVEAGYRTIVLQSGEDPGFPAEDIGEVIRFIKQKGAAVTVSCGEWPSEVYAYWRDCGADRYLLKQETADPALYGSLHPCGTLAERVGCLRELKRLGYETGSGFMIGLPGQTLDTIAQDLLLLAEIPCDMAGIGPFLPHPDTPLRDCPEGGSELTMRAVALARLLLPQCNLPATTSLGVLSGGARRSVFSCGANVIMRKVTPEPYKSYYEIYPANLGRTEVRRERAELEDWIRSMGKTPV